MTRELPDFAVYRTWAVSTIEGTPGDAELMLLPNELADPIYGRYECRIRIGSDTYRRYWRIAEFSEESLQQFMREFLGDPKTRDAYHSRHRVATRPNNTPEIDEELKPLIERLNQLGLITQVSCQGTRDPWADGPAPTDGHSRTAYVMFRGYLPPSLLALIRAEEVLVIRSFLRGRHKVSARCRGDNEDFVSAWDRVLDQWERMDPHDGQQNRLVDFTDPPILRTLPEGGTARFALQRDYELSDQATFSDLLHQIAVTVTAPDGSMTYYWRRIPASQYNDGVFMSFVTRFVHDPAYREEFRVKTGRCNWQHIDAAMAGIVRRFAERGIRVKHACAGQPQPYATRPAEEEAHAFLARIRLDGMPDGIQSAVERVPQLAVHVSGEDLIIRVLSWSENRRFAHHLKTLLANWDHNWRPELG